MAIKTITVCDRCGKECFFATYYTYLQRCGVKHEMSVDLCNACAHCVLRWILEAKEQDYLTTDQLSVLWDHTKTPMKTVRI